MPWKEFTVDNSQDTNGKSRRRDKAYIMLHESKNLHIRITARFHDGHFKWYLDVPEADIHEQWIAVVGVENKKSIKRVAVHLIQCELSRSQLISHVALQQAEKDIDKQSKVIPEIR